VTTEIRNKSLYIIDDFHPMPEQLREHALHQTYIDWLGHDGQVYKRICKMEIPGVQYILESLLGPIEMLGMAYRLNFDEEVPNSAIHSDLGWGTHALVLYLSNGPSGTAFWQHKLTVTDRIDQGDTWLFEQINRDWNNEDAWEQTKFIPMQFNRALIYESALFHSRYPFRAFGNSPETGRLIVVAFFNLKDKS
jgi:hypothetical protein